MGIAKFIADVAAVGQKAAAGTIPGISSIVSGPHYGQVIFTIRHENPGRDVQIRATCEDPTDYPEETAFTLSVPNGAPSPVNEAVKSIQDFLVGVRLYEVALALSESLQKSCLSAMGSEEELEDEAAEDNDESDYDDWANEEFGLPIQVASDSNHVAPDSSPEPHKKPRRMRLDLRQVRDAGYKVGFLNPTAKSGNGGTVSLSIRINKLGLSKDLMEAWDVEPADYFVLLIRFGLSYPTLETIIERPAEGMQVNFRVGKCSSYKPSPEQAALAFLPETERRTNSEARESTEGPESSAPSPDTPFRKLFLSNSLDQYLNQNLISLIKIRNRDGSTWDVANETYRQQHTGSDGNPGSGPSPSLPGPVRAGPSLGTADLLGQDHWRDAGRQGSFPLVAMQFAMRNFMKCNSFCLVCHRPVVDDEIEALRPYVCSDPLCLFQYLSMGFGPSTEHEILTQPLVVDLLVSLCYAAIVAKDGPATSSIRDLPVGLQLRVPNISQKRANPLQGEVDSLSVFHSEISLDSESRRRGTLSVTPTSLPLGMKIFPGQWIAFQLGQQRTLHHGQIVDVIGHTVHVEEAALSSADSAANLPLPQTVDVRDAINRTGPTVSEPAPRPSEDDPNHVEIFLYDADFDSLGNYNTKVEAMRLVLDTLPSVHDMAAYLRSHPGCTLRTMPRVTPAAASLLAWIISSNRSCIYQIDQSLPKISNGQDKTQSTGQGSGQHWGQTGGQPQGQINGQPQPETGTAAGLAVPPKISAGEDVACGRNREQERIGGMHGWVQFRFAQGSPDKELRFKQALQAASGTCVKAFPTLLGWHGSPVYNWHSILRTGLNFNTISNGRSFGHGVYFSRHYETSHGYCGNRRPPRWKNSELAVQSCVSLNEIINDPPRWRASQPHYVIAQPDWHQCRYLFVERTVPPNSEAALMKSASEPTGSGEPPELFPQEPGREITGPGGAALKVPLSAIPYRGGITGYTLPSSSLPSPSKRKSPEFLDSDEEEREDIALIFSDSENNEVKSSRRSRKRQTLPSSSKSKSPELLDSDQEEEGMALDFSDSEGNVVVKSSHQSRKRRSLSLASDSGVSRDSSAQMARRLLMADKKMTDFEPGSLDLTTLPRLGEPSFSNHIALRALGRELSKLQATQAKTPMHELGWYLHAEAVTNLFQWVVEMHSFDASLPLAADMKSLGITSIVLELRFPGDFPMSPPFVRVVRPRFLPFTMGGGGHVTGGGAMCMELLTTSGWSPANSMESVLLQVRLAMTNLEPRPGRIWDAVKGYGLGSSDYGVGEAIEAYKRAVQFHGWKAPANLMATAHGT